MTSGYEQGVREGDSPCVDWRLAYREGFALNGEHVTLIDDGYDQVASAFLQQ